MSSRKNCRAPDCDRLVTPKSGQGLCEKHYANWRRRGLIKCKKHQAAGEAESYLRSFVSYEGDDCLIWPYWRDKAGYGACRVNGVRSSAHRHMCIIAHGPPPFSNAEAAHSCGKGHLGCFSPKHVRWATSAENAADKIKHGTTLKGEMAACAKLTAKSALEVYRDPRPVSLIMKQYRINAVSVWSIKNGVTWKHVTNHVPSMEKKPRVSPPRSLTDSQVKAIFCDNRTYRVIAEEYGVSFSMVSQIKNRKARAPVTASL